MKHICYHPWAGLTISPQQEFRPCCMYSHSLADNLSDYQNSLELAELKDQLLKGQKPIGCKKCWDDEDKDYFYTILEYIQKKHFLTDMVGLNFEL